MEVCTVSNRKRQILNMVGEFYYVYIPMTPEEKAQFAPDVVNACWRVTVPAKEAVHDGK